MKRPYALYSGTKRAHVRHWHHSRPAHTDRRPFFPTRASRSAPTRSRPPLPTAGSTRSRSEGANNAKKASARALPHTRTTVALLSLYGCTAVLFTLYTREFFFRFLYQMPPYYASSCGRLLFGWEATVNHVTPTYVDRELNGMRRPRNVTFIRTY